MLVLVVLAAGAGCQQSTTAAVAAKAGVATLKSTPAAADSSLPVVELPVLRARQEAKDTSFLVIDARQPHEYATGHIPGAINVPYTQLEAMIGQLPRDKELIVYCYGKGCGISKAVAMKLAQSGFPKVAELDGGVSEWKLLNLPVEQ